MPVMPSQIDAIASSHAPSHKQKRTQSSLEDTSLGEHDWPTTASLSDCDFDFAFDQDSLQQLDLSNIFNIENINSSGSRMLRVPEAMSSPDTSGYLQSATNRLAVDFSKLYTLENSSLDALTPSPLPSSPLPSRQTIGLRSMAEVIQELHDESHAERLALQEQMDAEKGTHVVYPHHYSRYLMEWSLDQDQRITEDPT